MKPCSIWYQGFGLAVLSSWAGSAGAFEVALSGAVERSSTNARVEVFATLIVPLDEWTQVTPEVMHWVNTDTSYARAWDQAEGSEELAVAADAAELQWLVEPTWMGTQLVGTQLVGTQWPPGPWAETTGFGQAGASGGAFSEPERGESAAGESAAGESATDGGARAGSAPPAPRPVRVNTLAPPKFDRLFLRALMAACNHEFRDIRTQLDDLASRARLSAWLPELQLKGGRSTDQTLRLTPTDAEPDRYQVVGGDGLRLEGQMRWTFSQLVFARDELAVARLRGAIDVEKRKRQHQAMAALSKWLEAWTVLASSGAEAGERLEAWVSESVLRAELDWLSQGWFSAHVPAAPEWADVQGE